MKITIDSVIISEEKFEVVAKLESDLQRYNSSGVWSSDRDFGNKVVELVAEKIAQDIILSRGAEIMNQVTNNQIINALIMKVAGKLGDVR